MKKVIIAMMVMVMTLMLNPALAVEIDSSYAWNVVAKYVLQNGYDERYIDGFVENDAYFCIGILDRAEIQEEVGFDEPFERWLIDGAYETALKSQYGDVQVAVNFIESVDGIDIYSIMAISNESDLAEFEYGRQTMVKIIGGAYN